MDRWLLCCLHFHFNRPYILNKTHAFRHFIQHVSCSADFGWHCRYNSFGSMPMEILSTSNKIIGNGHILPDLKVEDYDIFLFCKGKEPFLYLAAEPDEHILSHVACMLVTCIRLKRHAGRVCTLWCVVPANMIHVQLRSEPRMYVITI